MIKDLIASFYSQKITNSNDYPESFHRLEIIRCRDFLNLDSNVDALSGIKVPEEGFDLLIDVVGLIGYTEPTARILLDNLPQTYPLETIPKNLLELMYKQSKYFQLIIEFSNKVCICSTNDEKKLEFRIVN